MRPNLGLSVCGLAYLMVLAACGDDVDPNRVNFPATTPDSGAPPVIAPGQLDGGNTMQPVSMNPPGNVTPGIDSGAPPLVVVDSGISMPVVDSGLQTDAAVQMPTAPACTGKPGMRKGKSNQRIMAGGAMRSFIYYAPEGLDPNKAVPLVIVPHGTNMSGAGMYDLTEWWKIADREKFIAIFPDGIDGPGSLVPWNVGEGVCGLGAFVAGTSNDKAFMDELIKFAQADQCIDEQHIFMTGFSMGGYFSNENGCMNPKIRAIGPHSGGSHDLAGCANQHKPVIIFHFETDSLIEYACGSEARDRWVKKNGCSMADPEVKMVKGGKCEYYKGCPADGQVALCHFSGGDVALPPGHAWSGGKSAGENSFAASPDTESSTELGWEFFKKYAW